MPAEAEALDLDDPFAVAARKREVLLDNELALRCELADAGIAPHLVEQAVARLLLIVAERFDRSLAELQDLLDAQTETRH